MGEEAYSQQRAHLGLCAAACKFYSHKSITHLSILKPRRGPGQGDGPRTPENIGRRIAIRRSEIDRDVNFAKKTRALLK